MTTENRTLTGHRHLLPATFHPTIQAMIQTGIVLLLLVALAGVPARGQESKAPSEKTDGKKEGQQEKKKPEPYLLAGTVFNEGGFSLPGAEIRVRRAGEKKVREKARSDRRGEFGIRLPAGQEYEVTVEAKGYEPQTRKFAAQLGAVSNFVFRMQPAPGGKP